MIYEDENGNKRWTPEVTEGVDLLEMAMNIRQGTTGLPVCIWVSTGEASGTDIGHGPRIKAMSTHDQRVKKDLMYSIGILPPHRIVKPAGVQIDQDDFKKVISWIELNKDSLLAYWNDEIDAPEFLKMIKK